jgi:hypothetical protein
MPRKEDSTTALRNPPEKATGVSRQATSAGNFGRNDAEDLHARDAQVQTTVRMKVVGATAEPRVVGTGFS